MRGMWWVVGVVTAVVAVATYLTWTAARVERLHGRAGAAQVALGAQLARRAQAASTLAEAAQIPTLARAARLTLDAGPEEREAAENDLTRQLRDVVCNPQRPAVVASDTQGPVVDELVAVSRRVALARQVHNDVVRDALAVRVRLPVRMLRLARDYPPPSYFDVDDPSLDHFRG